MWDLHDWQRLTCSVETANLARHCCDWFPVVSIPYPYLTVAPSVLLSPYSVHYINHEARYSFISAWVAKAADYKYEQKADQMSPHKWLTTGGSVTGQ